MASPGDKCPKGGAKGLVKLADWKKPRTAAEEKDYEDALDDEGFNLYWELQLSKQKRKERALENENFDRRMRKLNGTMTPEDIELEKKAEQMAKTNEKLRRLNGFHR